MKVAIPRFGESVAPCFEYSATMAIFTVEDDQITDQVDVRLQSRVPHDRVRLIKAENVDTVICGGVQDFYEELLLSSGIQVISWVSGDVGELLGRFIEGRLLPGTTLSDATPPTPAKSSSPVIPKIHGSRCKAERKRRE